MTTNPEGEFIRRLVEEINANAEHPMVSQHDCVILLDWFRLVEEARRDFFPFKKLQNMEKLQERLERDGTLTQLERAYIKQTIKIMKWFGDERSD